MRHPIFLFGQVFTDWLWGIAAIGIAAYILMGS
jgi:hypothetical protein